MSLKQLKDVTYFKLNNEINIPVNGSIPLAKDKEAITAFFKENVEPNRYEADTYIDKLNWLVKEEYLEAEFLEKYKPEFITNLRKELSKFEFHFDSFMAAYKF